MYQEARPRASPWCSEVSSRPPSGRWWRNGRSTKVCRAHAAQLHADLVEAVPAHAGLERLRSAGSPSGRRGWRPRPWSRPWCGAPSRRPRARSRCRSRSRALVGREARRSARSKKSGSKSMSASTLMTTSTGSRERARRRRRKPSRSRASRRPSARRSCGRRPARVSGRTHGCSRASSARTAGVASVEPSSTTTQATGGRVWAASAAPSRREVALLVARGGDDRVAQRAHAAIGTLDRRRARAAGTRRARARASPARAGGSRLPRGRRASRTPPARPRPGRGRARRRVRGRAGRSSTSAPPSAPTQLPTASLKKPRLRFVEHEVRHVAARGEPQHVLALEPAHLVPRRDARAQLDQLVVEERHAHLERAGHRGAVEVGEHVVHQAEPRVQVERGLERRGARGAGQPAVENAPPRRPRARRARRRRGRRAGRRARSRSRRAGARPGRGPGARRPGAPARPGPWRSAAAAAPRAAAPGSRPQLLGQRGDAVLAVAAEELVGALAGERDGHVARARARRAAGSRARRGRPAARRGARRGGVRSPGSVRRRTSSSWCSAPQRVGDPAGVGELRVLAGEADREGLDAARSCGAPSARRSGSSRGRRSASRRAARRSSAAAARTRRACRARSRAHSSADRWLGSGSGAGIAPPALDRALAVRHHEPLAGLELAHLRAAGVIGPGT